MRLICLDRYSQFLPWLVLARPKLGDDEWLRCFRVFLKLFKNYAELLNDGKFDSAIWQRMRLAWTRLEVD
jgi:hypothetical protein